MIRCGQHADIIAAARSTVPTSAGVYLFYGGSGKVIYVGKSVNLRQRLLSYFQREHGTVHPRTGRMILAVRGFDFINTDGELQALLVEDELIKEIRPEYNVRQNDYHEYRYLLVTNDPYPAVKIVSGQETIGGEAIFGPYRDCYLAADLLDLVHRYFHLRTCGDPVPLNKCMHHEIGRCKGPCRGAVSTTDYAEVVKDTVGFFDGEETVIIPRIEREMEAAVTDKLYEQAAILRDKITFCRRFCAKQRFFRKFSTERLVVVEKRGRKTTHVFIKGRLDPDAEYAPGNSRVVEAVGRKRVGGTEDPRFILDRANIVYNWVNKNRPDCDYYFQSPETTPP